MSAERNLPPLRASAAAAAGVLLTCLWLAAACGTGRAGGADGLGEPAGRDGGGGGGDTGKPGADVIAGETGGPQPGGNRPPTLQKIGDKVVVAGQTLEIVLRAEDPDNDPLTYSMFGQVPLGASFDKESHKFTWTPKADRIGECAYVTFVVSDGTDFDRETVQICVTDQATPHPPEFVPVASQYPVVGETFKLQLEATDPDGDALTYEFAGAYPNGASLDAASGAFTWTPTAADLGPPIRISFRVTDGALAATLEILFFVQSGGTAAGRPPAFDPVAPQQAQVGQPLTFTVSARDPDGDPLTYSMRPGGPATATFSAPARQFSWTPASADAGRSFEVTFEVSDGTHNAFLTVDIAVGEVGGGGGTCQADRFEPNDEPDAATALTPGVHASLSLCDAAAPDRRDVDWYRIAAGAGETLTVDIRFAHNKGDIDAQLFRPGLQDPVVIAESSNDDERVEYAAPASENLLLAVYGYTGGAAISFANGYDLEVRVTQASTGCIDDEYEQNDTEATAATLALAGLAAGIDNLRVCPGDRDWYRFDLSCGQRFELLVTFRHADGDLDAYLFAPGVADAVAVGNGTADDETLLLPSAPVSGTYLLAVEGYPRQTATNRYGLLATVSPAAACTEDPREPNDTMAQASPLQGDQALRGMALCCGPDWFRLDLQAGEAVAAEARVLSGDLTLRLLAADGTTVLASSTSSGATRSIESAPAAAAGTVYLQVVPVTRPATYELDVIRVRGGAGCTAASCDIFQVCDRATGQCVGDYCQTANGCPQGYVCRDTFCVDACTRDADCRPDYRCKAFADGRYCGPVSADAQPPGSGCDSLEFCQGEAICWTGAGPGFCAELGCRNDFDCPLDALCGMFAGQRLCLVFCLSSGDCLSSELSCRYVDIPGGGEEQACVP
jgi:hypothetical protein